MAICDAYVCVCVYFSAETRDYVLNFLKDVRGRFLDKFNQVANSQPEIASFVQTL